MRKLNSQTPQNDDLREYLRTEILRLHLTIRAVRKHSDRRFEKIERRLPAEPPAPEVTR